MQTEIINREGKKQEQARRLSRYWQEMNKLDQKKEKDGE